MLTTEGNGTTVIFTPKLKFTIPVFTPLTLLKSLVKTPEASPYSVPLALFKTPSTSLQINKTTWLMPNQAMRSKILTPTKSSGYQSPSGLTV